MTGCGELPDTPAGLTLYPVSGIDQESWALVPAGEFFAGQFDEATNIDSEFEIMVTEDGRIWKRNTASPEYCSPNVGFRCVRNL